MSSRAFSISVLGAFVAIPLVVNCSSPDDPGVGGTGGDGTSGTTATGGAAPGGSGGVSTTGGAAGTSPATGGSSGAGVTGGASGAGITGGTGGTGGASGAGETGGSGGISGAAGTLDAGSGGVPPGGAGGVPGGTGGAPGGTGGASGASGAAGKGGAGGTGGSPMVPPLDCGGKGIVIENAGPPANRVNYAILGDGYTQAQLDAPATTAGSYQAHIKTYMDKRFSAPIGEPYLRYRKFVNICAIKIPSTPICGSSTFGCCGNDSSRLATCNNTAANNAIRDNLPASFETDWRAVVLNGSSWWNTGAALMLWSGGNRDAAGAALHEGGHGHHQLADEYGDCSSSWVNNTNNNTTSGGKWDAWLNTTQTPTATGMQGFFACTGSGHWRPSDNSMMNSLFGNNPNTSFNSVSREKMVMDIWMRIANPWDSVVPPAGAVTNPATLTVNVIDPAVISVDWSVDGAVVMPNGGPTFNASTLAAGSHMVSARAYDNAGMDLVRQKTGTTFNRQYWNMNAQKTVTWTVTKQ